MRAETTASGSAISTTGEVGKWSNTLDFSNAQSNSTAFNDAQSTDFASLEMLDNLIGELLQSLAQPANVTAAHQCSMRIDVSDRSWIEWK
ncbi:MAG: hypothetical protein WKF77_09910 [Planctomycetaceae bacterium]